MKTQDKPICIREVNENLRRIKLDMELTRPLKQLNTHCEFKEKYEEWCNIQDGLPENFDVKKEECKAKKREYHQRPEVKAKQRERMKEYYQRKKLNIHKSKWRVKE